MIGDCADRADRLPALVAELVRLKVDVIVSGGAAATRPARDATATIPIVMTQENDPVASGFVASKQTVPGLARVAVLCSSTDPGNARSLRDMEAAAPALGVQMPYLDVLGPGDLEARVPGYRQGARRGSAGAADRRSGRPGKTTCRPGAKEPAPGDGFFAATR